MLENDPEVKPKSEIALREEKILAFWKEQEIFKKTLEKESPAGEFVFYEGPPTANAAPALHHLEARAFKDIIPRYKTMRGFHVRRKGGWDTHGLPVELQVEKKLGLKSKKEIETFGIAEFNAECRASVWGHIDTWHRFTDRIGYWVDQVNPYVTYENRYIESLWNIVSHINTRRLLYKDYKVVPWCPRCGTALSSHELAQGYADITDISVYVKFKVVGQENTYLLAWTTTPWTLPGNVGLAVGEDVNYVKIKEIKSYHEEEGRAPNLPEEEFLILAKERLDSVISTPYSICEEMTGKDLLSFSYEPIYPYLSELDASDVKLQNAFKVYAADFVTTTDGTGIVHTAVMYGQEDFELGTEVDLPKFHVVAPDGTFIPGMGDFSGKHVRDEETAVDVIKDLAHRGLLFKKEKHKHSYPHCWRCKTALIYYARDSWYIRMSSLRGDLERENQKVNWEPAHIKEGRFGEWLREVKDWAISRERYWGTPLPIWTTNAGTIEVVSSIDRLKVYAKKSHNTYIGMRHGEADHNVQNIWSSNISNTHHLTEKGRGEVQKTAENMKGVKIDYIFVSPFLRTKETAEIVSNALGVPVDHVVFDDRLHEWNVGVFDGKPMDDYFSLRRQSKNSYMFEAEGAESYRNIVRRVGEFMYELERTYQNKRILIISHGAVLRALSFITDGLSVENEAHLRHRFENYTYAESRTIPFIPLPHNDFYELDLHRPYIDNVELVDEAGNAMTRVKEVMDVWFDSGSMPFAQDHYPFENKEWVEGAGYPADFIAEAIDQTRGWFYTLLAVGVLMERGTPYKNVICLGHILDKEGKKMSKSIGNILDPWKLMDTYGVDVLRLWMYSVNQPGDSKNFDEKTVDEIVKKIFNPLSNIYSLVATYKREATSMDPYTSAHVLDVWILSRLGELVSLGTAYLDDYKVFEPVRLLRDFIQDFSTWYIRRSRERFKSNNIEEVRAVVSVTEHVLIELSKFMAPMAPFYADWLYQEVTGGSRKQSVHLEEWPLSQNVDKKIIDIMAVVRNTVSAALELRQKAGIKVRQPLASLTIVEEMPQEFLDIIADEINVKEVKGGTTEQDTNMHLDTVITEELKQEGIVRDIIRAIQDIRKKENCNPTEKVSLIVSTEGEMKKIFESNHEAISLPTLVSNITYSAAPQIHLVSSETGSFSVSIIG